MRLRVIHVSRYAPDMPALWVDTSEEKPILKAYVNGRYQTLSEEIPAGILTEDMIVNSLDSDAVDMPLSAAQGKILKSLLDEKQAALTPGTGIEITDDNTINVTLDTTVFKVVPSLPDSPAPEDMNKIHLVPSENVEENNSYKEYLWVNNKWEEIGTYVSTVDLTPYLTKEDAGKTYQTITDSSLQTQDKTVVGSINEVDTGLKSVIKPYVVDLTSLLAAQDSESISTAIGGIDNLNGTVQKNQVIFGTLANGTVAVGIRVLGNKTTLTYFVDSVVGLTVNEVIITNTSGTLTKTANTHAVLTENMVINNLESDETTLPLSAAQGKALKEEAETTTDNVTRIDKAVGNPVIEEVDLSNFDEVGYYWLSNGTKAQSAGYGIKHFQLNKGDLLLIRAYGSSSVNIIQLTDNTYNKPANKEPLLYTGVNATKDYSYLATEDCFVAVSCNTTVSNSFINLVKSPFNTAISDNSYMQYLHKVYEEYGAVYNDDTGYWEYGDLKDMTEEDCFLAALYALEHIQGDDATSFILDRYRNTSARTYFTKIYAKGDYNNTKLCLNSCFARNEKLEYLKLSKNITSTYLNIKNLLNTFRSSAKLRKIEDILSIYAGCDMTSAFVECASLRDVKIRLTSGANVNISFQDSPLLSYESIKYIVDNAANTAAITVTVHPTTYSYLTGTAQPTEEVGGTTEEWQALVTTAQGKQISFAVPEETQSEVTE